VWHLCMVSSQFFTLQIKQPHLEGKELYQHAHLQTDQQTELSNLNFVSFFSSKETLKVF
jgi:hypothetical protein